MTPEKVMRVYDNRLSITGYRPDLEGKLKNLYEAMYPNHTFSKERFLWRWGKNPCAKNTVVNIWDGDLLVAHETTNVSWFVVDQKRTLWGLSGTSLALDTYPGMKLLLSDARKKLYPEIQEIIGFPNANMYHISVTTKGNHIAGTIPFYYTESVRDSREYPIRAVTAFSKEHETLSSTFGRDYQMSVERSADYLNWRLIEKPDGEYRAFEYADYEGIYGYIVLNRYWTGNAFQCQIIDIAAPDDEVFCDLIRFAAQWAFENGCEGCKLWMTDTHHRELLDKLSFRAIGPAFSLITTYDGLDVSDCYITMAVSDIF